MEEVTAVQVAPGPAPVSTAAGEVQELSSSNSNEADKFCGDVLNAVLDYCDDGIDAFQECLTNAPALDTRTLTSITQGLERLHQELAGRVSSSMALFEQLCRSVVLQVPPLIVLPPQGGGSNSADSNTTQQQQQQQEQQQEELDAALSELRAQIQQEVAACEQLEQEGAQLDAQIHAYGGVGAYQAVGAAAVAAEGGQQVLQDLAAINAAQQQLGPLLARAAALQAGQRAAAKGSEAGGAGVTRGSGCTPAAGPGARQAPVLGSLENLPPAHLLQLPTL